jgi:hypothetical protein
MIRFTCVLIFAATSLVAASNAGSRRFTDLANPTEYTFHTESAKVIDILKVCGKRAAPLPEPLSGGFRERDGFLYKFGLFDQYTNRYWAGKRERDEDISPPEAGRIGTIEADFKVKVSSKGLNETLVTVVVASFQQQVGRRYQLFPHMQKVGRMVSVKSDTYYEYLFLLRLGELLGETGMPPIKGSAD